MITLNELTEFNSLTASFIYFQGVKWKEDYCTTIDTSYTGKVETEFLPDVFGFHKTLVHLKAMMVNGKIVKILDIGLQFKGLSIKLPSFILDGLLLSASPLKWRPYGKFI